MADPKGYLPPEGPRNAHRVPYSWMSGQNAHRVGTVVIYSPQEVILTTNEDAHRVLERYGLDELPADEAEAAHTALGDDDPEAVTEIVSEYRSGSEDVAPAPADEHEHERPAIPAESDLEDVPYRGDSDSDGGDSLQDLAQAYGIDATQSGAVIQDKLGEIRDSSDSEAAGSDDGDESDDEEASD